MFTLVFKQPGQPDRRILVESDEAVIGRNAKCDVRLEQPFVSNRHVKVMHGTILVDLGSRNGTFIAGERIEEPRVIGGEIVTIGQEDLTMEVLVEAAAEGSKGPIKPTVHAEFDAAAAGGAGGAEAEALRARVSELERQLRKATKSSQEASSAAIVVDRQAGEIQALQRKIQSLEQEASNAPPPIDPQDKSAISRLVFQLQVENQKLKKELDEIHSRPPTDAERDAAEMQRRYGREIEDLRRQNQALQDRLQGAGAGGAKPFAMPSESLPPPAPRKMPTRAVPEMGYYEGVLADLVARDADAVEIPMEAAPGEFFLVLSFRFMRRVEKVMTRMAASSIQLFDMNTMLPDTQGNVRGLTRDILADPVNDLPRRDLVEYLQELGKWTIATLGAHRKAAIRFAENLRTDLSQEGLTKDNPIPKARLLVGQGDSELWKRVCEYLKELSPDMIEDRVEQLARESVQEFMDSQ